MATSPLARHPGRACAILIALHAVLLCWSARTNSVTVDEFAHLPAGMAYWRHQDFSIYDANPPLLRLIAATPPAIAGADVPPTTDVRDLPAKDRHWVYARQFARANVDRYHALFFLARLAMIPVSCLGAYVAFRWSRDLYGPRAAVVACALYCLSPAVLAHAPLAATDVGTAVAMAAAAYAWWRFCRSPRPLTGTLAVLLTAAAQLCKFTSLLLWPAMLLIAVVEARRHPSRPRRAIAATYLASAAFSLLAVNAGYLFQGTGTRLADFPFRSSTMLAVQRLAPGLPVPLPHAAVEGFDAQKWESEGLHQGYLLGEIYEGARWYYYPVAIAVKTPTAVLLLAMLAVVLAVSRCRTVTRDELPLLLTAAIFLLGTTTLARMNIGLRYLLPAYPLAHIFLSRLWSDRAPSRQPHDAAEEAPAPRPPALLLRPTLRNSLLAFAFLEPLLAAPDFLSFTNLLTRGPRDGWRAVNDSNYDWGQDLLRLRNWMTDNHVDSVHLGYFGRVDPVLYGIDYTPINRPSASPYVVVSTYYLAGLAHRTPSLAGPTPFTHIPFHAALAAKPPRTIVGRTLYVYDRQTVADAMTGERHP